MVRCLGMCYFATPLRCTCIGVDEVLNGEYLPDALGELGKDALDNAQHVTRVIRAAPLKSVQALFSLGPLASRILE